MLKHMREEVVCVFSGKTGIEAECIRNRGENCSRSPTGNRREGDDAVREAGGRDESEWS